MTSLSVMPPTPVWMTFTPHLGVLDLLQLATRAASTEPSTSPLTTRFSSWTWPSCRRSKTSSSDMAGRRRRGELLAAQARLAQAGDVARLALVLDDARQLAGARRVVEAEDLDGIARRRLLDLVAAEVVEGAHAAPGVAGDDRVADAERAALDEHRRDRAAADVEARLDDRPGGLGVRVRLQHELGVGDEQDALQQVVEIRLRLGGDLGELRRAAPLLRLEVLGGELGADTVRVGVRQVDLVDGDDDRHLRPRARARSTRASAA